MSLRQFERGAFTIGCTDKTAFIKSDQLFEISYPCNTAGYDTLEYIISLNEKEDEDSQRECSALTESYAFILSQLSHSLGSDELTLKLIDFFCEYYEEKMNKELSEDEELFDMGADS